MNNNDLHKSINDIARICSGSLAALNQENLKIVSQTNWDLFASSISSAYSTFSIMNKMAPDIQNTIKLINSSYSKLLMDYKFDSLLNKGFDRILSDVQIKTMFQLSQSAQTDMIKSLTKCFTDANYNAITKIINSSLNNSILYASDIAFIKTSDLLKIYNKEIKYPRGIENSLRQLNVSTANEISRNSTLVFNSSNKRFISSAGEVDSTELNILCSGKKFLFASTGEIIKEDELVDFMSFLYKTPMIGATYPTGKKIYDLINSLFVDKRYSIDFDEPLFFHSRSRKKTEMPFPFDQMLKAPVGLPWAGRYNQVGRSNYYFSNTQKGAESEVKKHLCADDVIQTVKLKPKRRIEILDLSGTLPHASTFLAYLRFSLTDKSDKMPKEYLIPCFVADCCKCIGFEGIKYYGSKEYNNYVVWDDGFFDYAGMCS